MLSPALEARELWGDREGYIYTKFEEIFENLGVKLLGIVPGGFLGVGAKDLGNLETVFDLSVNQGVLIRHPSMDVAAMIVKALGFNNMAIAYSDLYTALQTGVVDGWYGGGAGLNYTGFRDVISYFADYRYLFEVMDMLISAQTFEKLPAEYQELIVELAIAEQPKAFDEFQAYEEAGYAQLEEYGIEVLIPTADEMSAMAESVRAEVYPQLNDLFGEDVMAAISEQVAGLSK